jgi:predicted NUDIX family phosphoesterase
MSHFLEAAYAVLKTTGEPLPVKQITERALSLGILTSSGKTPWQTMKSKLSLDILKKRELSAFMRTDQGTFGLREWKADQVGEYVANRYMKSLLDELVVVFPFTSLSRYIPHTGLNQTTITNGRDLIAECKPMLRRKAEEDFSVIQLVSVFIVHYDELYLTYKRTRRLPETRLHGTYSMIFGGHLNPEDLPSLFNIFDPREGRAFIARELREEVRLPQQEGIELSYRGLLYDDRIPLSRQHLGIVYDVALGSMEYEIGERGFLIDSRFETLEQIAARRRDFENWSTLILEDEIERRKGSQRRIAYA